MVSANDILQKSLDPNEYRIVNGSGGDDGEKTKDSSDPSSSKPATDTATSKELNVVKDDYENVPLNEDDDPIIIKKPNNEEVVYKQNVFIRWLQPPTPPPPAPIISNLCFRGQLIGPSKQLTLYLDIVHLRLQSLYPTTTLIRINYFDTILVAR